MNDDIYASSSFEEFWPHYVRLHRRAETHWLHAAATSSSVALLGAAMLRRQPVFLFVAPLVNHLIAQAGHRLFEQNRSTPWRNPLRHARAELRMLRLVLSGRMLREVDQHCQADDR